MKTTQQVCRAVVIAVATVVLVGCGGTGARSSIDAGADRFGTGGARGTGAGCGNNGATCRASTDCCSGSCQNGTCIAGGACLAPGTACTAAGSCCSGRCETVTGENRLECTNVCAADGVACGKSVDCCSLGCFGGVCGGGLCKVESENCSANAECCSNICQGGQCRIDEVNRDCRPVGETCNSGTGRGCCTTVCDERADPKRCDFGNETCRAEGGRCTADAQCCRGICDVTTRTCRTPCAPAGASCTTPADCCGGACTNGQCGTPNTTCKSIGGACTNSAECCGNACVGGRCTFVIV